MNKDGLSGYAYDFSVDYNTIDVSDIIDNDKYLLKKKKKHKTIFVLIIKAFISLSNFNGSTATVFKVSDSTKCISLNNQQSIIRSTLYIIIYFQ